MIQSYAKLFEQTSISPNQQYLAIPSALEPRIILPMFDKRVFTSALRIQNTAAPLNRLKKFMLGATYPLPTFLLRPQIVSETPLLQELLGFLSNKVRWNLPLMVSGYCGSEGKNRKLTLQVMKRDGEILGFVKIGDTASAQEFIRCENRACEIVEVARLENIEAPKSLLLTEWNDWVVYLQSSIGEGSVAIGYNLNDRLVDALINLAEKTSDPQGKNALLDSVATKVRMFSAILGEQALGSVHESLSVLRSIDFPLVLVHGDFVPYNVRKMKNRFAVFDWEYFMLKGPLFFDMFHFLYQGYFQIRKMAPHVIVKKKIFGHSSNMDCMKKYADHFRIPHSAIPHFFRVYLAQCGILEADRSEDKTMRHNHFFQGIEAFSPNT